MTSWNQGELFLVSVVSQLGLDVSGGPKWELKIKFTNLAIEPAYFGQCLDSLYSGDEHVSLDGNIVTLENNLFLEKRQLHQSLVQEAWLLVQKLSEHPKWGKVGGPNMMAEHEDLD
jgi:hypothetical protein